MRSFRILPGEGMQTVSKVVQCTHKQKRPWRPGQGGYWSTFYPFILLELKPGFSMQKKKGCRGTNGYCILYGPVVRQWGEREKAEREPGKCIYQPGGRLPLHSHLKHPAARINISHPNYTAFPKICSRRGDNLKTH